MELFLIAAIRIRRKAPLFIIVIRNAFIGFIQALRTDFAVRILKTFRDHAAIQTIIQDIILVLLFIEKTFDVIFPLVNTITATSHDFASSEDCAAKGITAGKNIMGIARQPVVFKPCILIAMRDDAGLRINRQIFMFGVGILILNIFIDDNFIGLGSTAIIAGFHGTCADGFGG